MIKLGIKKGTVVSCEKCGSHLLKTSRDIWEFEFPKPDDFIGISIFPKTGDRFICPNDETPFFVNGKFHTTEGWLPW